MSVKFTDFFLILRCVAVSTIIVNILGDFFFLFICKKANFTVVSIVGNLVNVTVIPIISIHVMLASLLKIEVTF